MKYPSILTAALAILGSATVSTEAAMVTWGAAANIAGDSDVSTNGTRVMAYNFGDPNVTATTVNGVTFDPFPLLTNDSSVKTYTVGNATLSTADDRGPRGATTSSYQSLSVPYLKLLTSTAELIADRQYKLTLSGLTAGEQYEFQVWSNNSDRSSNFPDFFPTFVDDGLGNGDELYPGDNGTDGGGTGINTAASPGQHLIGTFIADASSQEIFMGGSEVSGIINGFQLRQSAPVVPEPGTALFGLALGVATLFRRGR